MPNKFFFASIKFIQEALLAVSIGLLIVLPIVLAYFSAHIPAWSYTGLFGVSLGAVFLVMIIRPLTDLLPNITWLRPLVMLRKGFGVLSASIIVAILLSKCMSGGFGYVLDFFSPERWSLEQGAILAPIADLSALILLLTSNKFSKRVLGKTWKRVQKLAYVYFFAGALYEYLLLHQVLALLSMILVAVLVLAAYIKNQTVRSAPMQTV